MKLLVTFSPANASVDMFPRYRIDAIITISWLPLKEKWKKKKEKTWVKNFSDVCWAAVASKNYHNKTNAVRIIKIFDLV